MCPTPIGHFIPLKSQLHSVVSALQIWSNVCKQVILREFEKSGEISIRVQQKIQIKKKCVKFYLYRNHPAASGKGGLLGKA